MSFQALIQNTDIVITVGSLVSELNALLDPMTNVPYELSLGNRPILWHCLAPLVDAGARNFFICITEEWQPAVKKILETFTAHHNLRSNFGGNSATSSSDHHQQQHQQQRICVNFSLVQIDEAEYTENQNVAQIVHYARHHRKNDSIKDFMVVHFDTILSPQVIETFVQGFTTNFASCSTLFVERGLDAPEDIESDYICIDDSTPTTPIVFPGLCFAEHRRLHDSEPVLTYDPLHPFRSSMLVRRPQMLFSKNFRQVPAYLFRPWVAHLLVLHYDAIEKENERQRELASNAAAAASSSSLPPGKKSGGSNGNAYAATNNQQQQRQASFQKLKNIRDEFLQSLMLCQYSSFVALPEHNQKSSASKLKFRTVTSCERLMEDLSIPISTNFKIPPHWCLASSSYSHHPLHNAFMMNQQQQQHHQNNGVEDGNINNNNNTDYDYGAANHQQQQNFSDGVTTGSNSVTPQNNLLVINNNNNTNNRNNQQQQHQQQQNSVLLIQPPTLDVLNAAAPNLAPASDEIRVFCTLIRRGTGASTVLPNNNNASNATSGGGPALDVNAASLAANTQDNTFPVIKRVDTAKAYNNVVALLREGLEIPPPPIVNSIQRYAVPDMHAMTLDLLNDAYIANVEKQTQYQMYLIRQQETGGGNNNNNASGNSSNNNNTTSHQAVQNLLAKQADLLRGPFAPQNLLRCCLLTLPPTPPLLLLSQPAAAAGGNTTSSRVERCIIGKNVKFGENCALFDSVIMDNVELGSDCKLRGCIVGPQTVVRPKATFEYAILSGTRVEYISTTTGGKK